ncbi:MAG: coiled-coil domain-containing protein [Candidatus Heimdallarchaeota archaeon]
MSKLNKQKITMTDLEEELKLKEQQIKNFQQELQSKEEKVSYLQKQVDLVEQKIEKKIKDIELQLKTKDEIIANLQSSVKLKDDQIQTLKDSLNLKDEQVETLDTSIKFKDEKINTLERTLKLKEEEIKNFKVSSIDKDLLNEKENLNKDLKEKLEILTGELTKADEDLETLEKENEKLRNQLALSEASKIIDWTDVSLPKTEILEKMREILMKALHNVTIAVPNIKQLQELYLYDVRSSVNMKISCSIDPLVAEDSELLEELESLDNISIRMYEGQDRYILDRDGEELLFAVIGKNENNHLVLHTRDPKHLKLFRALVMEGWLRSRKIE